MDKEEGDERSKKRLFKRNLSRVRPPRRTAACATTIKRSSSESGINGNEVINEEEQKNGKANKFSRGGRGSRSQSNHRGLNRGESAKSTRKKASSSKQGKSEKNTSCKNSSKESLTKGKLHFLGDLIVKAYNSDTFAILSTFTDIRIEQVYDELGVRISCQNKTKDNSSWTVTASISTYSCLRGKKLTSVIDFLTEQVNSETISVEFINAAILKHVRAINEFVEKVQTWRDKVEQTIRDQNDNEVEVSNTVQENITLLNKKMRDTVDPETLRKKLLQAHYLEAEEELRRQEFELKRRQVEEFKLKCDYFILEAENLKDKENMDKELELLASSFGHELVDFELKMPIYGYRSQIRETVNSHQVTIVVAETGSGKSTQLAKFLLNTNMGKSIACTQPRKVAATGLADFVSKSLRSKVGKLVGYDFGCQKKVEKGQTKITFMTNHSLMLAWKADKKLTDYSCIIVDEAHERSLNIDLILSILKTTLKAREDFRLVITSATIDPKIFSKFFEDFSVKTLKIPGKIYPIQTVWDRQPLDLKGDYVGRIIEKINEILKDRNFVEKTGILAFVATPTDTERAQKMLRELFPDTVEILQLHGKLPLEEQRKVFKPIPGDKKFRIVFATNSAETSITVPGITVVVDSGIAKERQYDPQKNISSLMLGSINKSSARQRMGRAGRTAPGICYRLYRERDYEDFEKEMRPEILRLPLDLCILQVISLGVSDPQRFDFLEPPSVDAIENSIRTLSHLSAIEREDFGLGYKLTSIGKQMSLFHIDPRLSKSLIGALNADNHVLAQELITLCSIMTNGGNVFFRMGTDDDKEKADRKKMQFCDDTSDHITMLNVYRQWNQLKSEKDKGKWCSANYINGKSMKTIQSTVSEIRAIVKSNFKNVHLSEQTKEIDNETKAKIIDLLSDGFGRTLALSTGHPQCGYVCLFTNEIAHIHPSSSIFHMNTRPPKFIIYEQVMVTSKTYLLNVSEVDEKSKSLERAKDIISSGSIQRHLVEPFRISRIGSFVMRRYFIGRNGAKKRELENELREFMTVPKVSDFLLINCAFDEGVIEVWCNNTFTSLFYDKVQARVDDARRELIEEKKAEEIKGNSFSVIIENGGTILEPFLTYDFDTICIQQPYNRSKVEMAFEKNRFDIPFHDLKFLEDGRCLIIFVKPSYARSFLELVNHPEVLNETFEISTEQLFPLRKRLQFEEKSIFSLTLNFERRARTNYGFVQFASSTEAIYFLGGIDCLTGAKKTDKKRNDTVRLVPLDESFTEEKLRKIISTSKYGSYKITLPRAPAFISPEEEVEHLKRSVIELIEKKWKIPGQLFNLKEPRNEKQFVFWKFFLEFQSIASGLNAMRSVRIEKPTLSYNGRYYRFQSAEYQIYSKIVTFTDVYERFKEQIADICEDNINVSSKTPKNDASRTILNLSFKNIEEDSVTLKTLLELQDLLQGETISHTNIKVFANNQPWQKLMKLEKQHKVIFKKSRMNSSQPSVTIFGTTASRTMAKTHINNILSQLADDEVECFTVSLRSSRVKRGLLKKVVSAYGYELEKLLSRDGIISASLTLNGRYPFEVRGRSEVISEIREEIQTFMESLPLLDGTTRNEDEDCSICLGPPKPEERYCFELCGHIACIECFKMQVSSAELPLKCARENCSKMICVQDLRFLQQLNENDKLWEKFLKRTLDQFITSSQSYEYCPTPDCGGIYRRITKTDLSAKALYHCLDCKSDICTRCCVVYHAGYTCETFQLLKSENGSLKVWLQEDPTNRKLCPGCKIGVTKNEGCNHMHCPKCQKHFCWLCLKIFDGENIYPHIYRCEGRTQPFM